VSSVPAPVSRAAFPAANGGSVSLGAGSSLTLPGGGIAAPGSLSPEDHWLSRRIAEIDAELAAREQLLLAKLVLSLFVDEGRK
jgi:hypothetical protein